MATHLQQLLRSLCWNTEWNYAVFWKLKHHHQMVLTWEDAWYDNHFKDDPPESKSVSDARENWHDSHFAHDPLALAVAKMSYHVYSHGKGIVSEVAVTGKHRWIIAGDYPMNPSPSLELCDGWQEQFSAGIKTIVVASAVPHGVVQLGSLNKVNEDLKLLTHIRDIFSSLLYSSACLVQNPVGCSMKSAMADTSTRTSCPNVFQETNFDFDWASSPVILSPQKESNDSHEASSPDVHLSEAGGLVGKNVLPEVIHNVKLIQPVYESSDLLTDAKCSSNSYSIQNEANFESAACGTTAFDGEDHPSVENLSKLVTLKAQARQKMENNTEFTAQYNCLEALDNLKASSMFSVGFELHEALGPAFLKQCYPWSCAVEKTQDRSTSNIPEITESSMLTSDSGSDHLLEAVVANFCHQGVTVKKTASFSTSESMLTTEKKPEPSINMNQTIDSPCYSVDCSSLLEESIRNCLNSSESCSIRSSTSACRGPSENLELGKANKKRARPGENPRPRPRDRQLIQDRIKELRELVPDGSKCSIDSLLERTIKHMFFLQSVTKHANKLSNCAESRHCSNEAGVPKSGYEQGSSWAVEVGGHMKICPIVVENLNMNTQMLIEMLCEDCDHFLKIAEAIRSLGLTILKGATDYHDDKTWMRFVVEGQNNRTLHRVDVLWSLVQILQSHTTA